MSDGIWRLRCFLRGHDYHYFALRGFRDGQPIFVRCCMICEHSEEISENAYLQGREEER